MSLISSIMTSNFLCTFSCYLDETCIFVEFIVFYLLFGDIILPIVPLRLRV